MRTCLNDELVNALVFYKMKEPKFYFLINSLMRGKTLMKFLIT